jgi:hypothetical protein
MRKAFGQSAGIASVRVHVAGRPCGVRLDSLQRHFGLALGAARGCGCVSGKLNNLSRRFHEDRPCQVIDGIAPKQRCAAVLVPLDARSKEKAAHRTAFCRIKRIV